MKVVATAGESNKSPAGPCRRRIFVRVMPRGKENTSLGVKRRHHQGGKVESSTLTGNVTDGMLKGASPRPQAPPQNNHTFRNRIFVIWAALSKKGL